MAKKDNQHQVTIEFPGEKLDALLVFLSEKDRSLEQELSDYVARLFDKTVPAAVRNYLIAKDNRAASSGPKNADP